ncbi:thioesterase II family protein [Nocardiopsis sp. NPDC055551]|uniref:thioesterase II family protein n=1 Tax=Nocardiopsis sp. NPDC006832 TaxID=3157188 RepID=UPI0033F67FC6
MRADLWLRGFHPAPEAPVRMVIFPHAGGSASYFFTLSRLLAPEVEVFVVQYPGRQDRRREPVRENVELLAKELVEELHPRDAKPTVFFGHSLGATVAFEVARRLEQAGVGPAALWASARCAPSDHRTHDIHLLDDEGIIAELRRLSGTDTSLLDDKELLDTLMPAIRGDYKAAETYVYTSGPPLACPVVGFVGDDDSRVREADLLGWRELTESGFELVHMPGGHFYPTDHPALTAEEFRTRLGSMDGSGTAEV